MYYLYYHVCRHEPCVAFNISCGQIPCVYCHFQYLMWTVLMCLLSISIYHIYSIHVSTVNFHILYIAFMCLLSIPVSYIQHSCVYCQFQYLMWTVLMCLLSISVSHVDSIHVSTVNFSISCRQHSCVYCRFQYLM